MGKRSIHIPMEKTREARQMLKEYAGARLRIEAYPRKRPTLLKQLKVDLSDYKEHGIVRFDHRLARRLDADDWFFFEQYLTDLNNVWLIDQVLEGEDEVTKEIARDAFVNRKTSAELAVKYGLKERTIRWHKAKTVRRLAGMLLV